MMIIEQRFGNRGRKKGGISIGYVPILIVLGQGPEETMHINPVIYDDSRHVSTNIPSLKNNAI
jgi:hypothetical protein